jgi:hypothetical protein
MEGIKYRAFRNYTLPRDWSIVSTSYTVHDYPKEPCDKKISLQNTLTFKDAQLITLFINE